MGISLDELYSHQTEALRHAFGGQNVVLQTPTASGKSLCYLLPVFRTLLNDPKATALFLFPTKALAFDQRKKITVLAEDFDEQSLKDNQFIWPLKFGGQTIYMGSYEREVRGPDQSEVKTKARIVVTNPDSLHMKILPWFSSNTGSWERFLMNLKFVVLDEIHVYRGLFGAHVAWIVRRLRMMCEQLGAKPQFFCSSATLPDPKLHAEDLVGLPFEAITKTGAPLYRKVVGLWNPALPERVRGSQTATRKEPTTDAMEVLAEALLKGDRPTQAITFMRTLAGVQRFNDTLRKRLKGDRNPASEKTAAYCARLILRERDEIAEGLLSRQIVHVTSTNALELGIDIGDLNACLMIGYPGTVSSFLQQSGRVGRKGPSIVLMFLKDERLEQWFARNPDQFFRHIEKVEPLRLPKSNPHGAASNVRSLGPEPTRRQEGTAQGADARHLSALLREGCAEPNSSHHRRDESRAAWIIRSQCAGASTAARMSARTKSSGSSKENKAPPLCQFFGGTKSAPCCPARRTVDFWRRTRRRSFSKTSARYPSSSIRSPL